MNCYEDNNTIRFDAFGDAPIYIGKVGENLVTSLDIDLTGALPEGWTVGLLLRRPGETAVYPKVGEMRENVYHVDFSSADTAKHGEGQATLVLYGENGEVKKSFLAGTKVTYTLSANGAAPDPITEWTTAANEKLAEVDAALEELNFHPVEKTEEMTQPVGVDADGKLWALSGGGGTGDHTQLINRDVANQHPISAITGLQSALDAKGTYSKPTGGIPATDLTQSAQASLEKADSAVQPSAIADMASKTWVGEQDYITEEEAPVQNVTINGTSIVEQQIAKIVYETGLGADSSNAATVTAIRAFVNSSINAVAAYYITADANRNAFATKAALDAGPWYYAGQLRTPTKNDYAIVIADETHGGNTARYTYTEGGWDFQYTFNMQFTQAQIDAINSGITAAKVALYDAHITSTANPHSVSKSQVGLGNVDNTSDATKKANFTGSIASGNTGFATGDAIYTALAGKADKPTVKAVMDAVAMTNTQYFLGTQSAVSITMPSTGISVGDEILVVFTSGATAATLTCDLTGFVFTPKANKTSWLKFTCYDATNGDWLVETKEG